LRQPGQRAQHDGTGPQGRGARLYRAGLHPVGTAHPGPGRPVQRSRVGRTRARQAQAGRHRLVGRVAAVIDVGSLTGWDWFVIGALLISTVWGVLSGLVRTVFALAGWVIGLVGAPIATPAVMQATGWNVHPLFVMALLFFALLVLV